MLPVLIYAMRRLERFNGIKNYTKIRRRRQEAHGAVVPV